MSYKIKQVSIDAILYKRLIGDFYIFGEDDLSISALVLLSDAVMLTVTQSVDNSSEIEVRCFQADNENAILDYIKEHGYEEHYDHDGLRLTECAFVSNYTLMKNHDSQLTAFQIQLSPWPKKRKPKIRREKRYYDCYDKRSVEDNLFQLIRNNNHIYAFYPVAFWMNKFNKFGYFFYSYPVYGKNITQSENHTLHSAFLHHIFSLTR